MRFSNYIGATLLAGICLTANAQESQFQYRRKITGIQKDEWHTVTLPADIFKNIQADFRDLRILNLNGNDTTEIQYLLDIMDTEVTKQDVSLSPLNESRNGNAYYITFSNSGYKVNYLELNFQETNYFATVNIEGSNDQKKWFTLAENEKIFSIENGRENYASSIINFPLTDFNFLRLTITSADKLNFTSAVFRLDEIKPGLFDDIATTFSISTDKKSKRSIIDVRLKNYQPVSNITLEIAHPNDFYRHITVEALVDSTKTERGWIRNYQMISGNLITSFKANQFSIPFTLTSRLRLVIENYDNPPLPVSAIRLNGAKVHLRAKLQDDNSYLFYGDREVFRPAYDIEHFKEKIPLLAKETSLGPEEKIGKSATPVSAIFENKFWLWGILLSIVAVLGFFTLRMMKTKV